MRTVDTEFGEWEEKRSFQNVFLLSLLTELEKRGYEVRDTGD
ncbi:MAG: hypothetical protein ACLFVX_02295 [Archaeoglobaceae archaeon]